MAYRRPGVYLEESLLVNPSDVAGTVTVGAFVGVAEKGQLNEPILIESWSDYVTLFGGFDPIQPPIGDPNDRTQAALGGLSFANLAALKADVTVGDGRYTGPIFDQGDFVTLVDASKAHYLQPAMATNRALAVNGNMFAADADITASDAPNAAKLASTTNEVQTLTMTGAPTGGTFTLTLLTDRLNAGAGVTTGAIAYNATSVVIKAAIDAAIAGNTIAVAGGPLPTAVTLTYTGMGNVDLAVVTPSLTGGTNPVLTPTTTTAGVGEGFATTPATAWTTGQNMWVGPHAFFWNGTAWAAGVAGGGTAKANNGVWTAGAYPGTPDAPALPPKVLSYLPYAVYSFFQNGGRFCWVIRSAPITTQAAGTASSVTVNGEKVVANLTSFVINARSVGTWGNSLKYSLAEQGRVDVGSGVYESIFAIQVLLRNTDGQYETVETFSGLSVNGNISGTRRVDSSINDLYSGSRYIRISGLNPQQPEPKEAEEVSLAGGIDPGIPDVGALRASAQKIGKVEGPININICGYLNDASKLDTNGVASAWVSTTVPGSWFSDREDVLVINDSAPPRLPQQQSSDYATSITSSLGANLGDSYSASYGPWLIIPDPRRVGTTLICPPGGAIMGMMARIDATIGVFRAPAGVIAGLSNAVGVQTKFTDSELGDLNTRHNINICRSVVGAGICCMGGRTRKSYGADKYISARRTLISIKESLRRSTQWAVFENNDQRLWSGLRLTADRILRPMWEAGGLAGVSAAEAYYIRCDATLNTPAVVQSGEVRMEVGVALEYPAEFVVIRITQFDRGTFTSEISPAS